MKAYFLDDKNIVIVGMIVISLCVIFSGELDPIKEKILTSIITGLFGVAIGRNIK